jgi:exodeoxyribonuclease VII large subunit
MSSSDEMPTLAALRRRPTKRALKAPASPGLFDAVPPEPEPKLRKAPAAAVISASVMPEPEAPKVWSVSALVLNVRNLVERTFTQVSVEGEISNWRPAASGHCYFTLKDGDAQLSVVMFRRQVQLLRFKPKDGDAVRLRGQLSIYESRGQMQLIAESMEQVGMGALLAAVRDSRTACAAKASSTESDRCQSFPTASASLPVLREQRCAISSRSAEDATRLFDYLCIQQPCRARTAPPRSPPV